MILIFGNKTKEDIVLKNELDHFQLKNNNFKVVYLIDKSEKDWNGETGFFNKELILKYCPEYNSEVLFISCGPKLMNQLVKKVLLDEMNVSQDNYHKI